MIECLNVNKTFHGKAILTNINLSVINGNITSLVGKNGAGKSTLIGLIVEYYKLDSGFIKKATVSVMPDADSLDNDITGHQFLNFISQLKNLPDNKQAIALAQELNIKKDLHKKIKSYSFGMKKKLSFIQACIGPYDAYVFDEPTSGVDELSAIKMLRIINQLKQEDSSILLTSHNLDEIERISDYIYVIEEGKIINEGTVDSIVSKKTNFVSYILISNTINLVVNKLSKYPNIYIKNITENKLELELEKGESVLVDLLHELIDNHIYFTELYKHKNTLRESLYKN